MSLLREGALRQAIRLLRPDLPTELEDAFLAAVQRTLPVAHQDLLLAACKDGCTMVLVQLYYASHLLQVPEGVHCAGVKEAGGGGGMGGKEGKVEHGGSWGLWASGSTSPCHLHLHLHLHGICICICISISICICICMAFAYASAFGFASASASTFASACAFASASASAALLCLQGIWRGIRRTLGV